MKVRRFALLCAVTILATRDAAAQAIATIALENRKAVAGSLKPDTSYELVLGAKTDSGDAAKSQEITVKVHNSDAQVKKPEDKDEKFGSEVTVPVGGEGQAKVTLRTKTNPDVVLDLAPVGAGGDAFEQTFYWRPIAKFSVTQNVGHLSARTVYPKALTIEAKQQDGEKPASFQKIALRAMGGADALVFIDNTEARSSTVTAVTDEKGKATVSLETGEMLDLQFLVTPLDKDDKEILVGAQTVKLSGLRTFDTFHSRRLYTEVFMGATFTNDYDANGDSTGFNQTSPLVRVTFDTLWYPAKPRDRGLIRGSMLHTGVDMEVTDFPFGKDAKENTGDPVPGEPEVSNPNKKGLASAFSGALFAVWQPDHWLWASYTPTSTLTGVPTDALRLGVFTRIGITTRTAAAKNGDTTFWRGQIGFRFTHHQTKAESARTDQDNIVPIRFVEISYGRFEEFANEVNANRLVLDAGFRLPGLGSDMIPFYAGIHLNAGRGADDLRIFAGFLFKINELATLFQRAGVE